MFDIITQEHIRYYVYILVDPIDGMPFYIGKGKCNRVFSHVECAIKSDEDTANLKYRKIREIRSSGNEVKMYILQHGLEEQEALLVESALISYTNIIGNELTNIVSGHNGEVLSVDDVIRIYGANDMLSNSDLMDECIIININKKYRVGESYYEAVKESWVVSKKRRDSVKYALAEYRGVIMGVYEIDGWYSVKDNKGKERWGFNGSEVRDSKFLYKKVNKRRGSANPIRYKVSDER